MLFWWNKRPEPRYEVGELVMIPSLSGAPRPIARYMIVRARRWINASTEWVYDGAVIVAVSNDGVIVVRQHAKGLSEKSLARVYAGNLGLTS